MKARTERALIMFIVSLFCGLFWSLLSDITGTPYWFVVVAGMIGFLGGWFGYAIIAGGAIKEEPKL